MSFIATAKVLARIILGLSPIIMDATGIIGKWKKKENASQEELPTRIERLEKNMELQADLNEQFLAEMRAVKPALEGIQRSLKLVFFLALFACLFSFVMLILAFFR
jgi:hypothetical protein